jgi:hypothetical protein
MQFLWFDSQDSGDDLEELENERLFICRRNRKAD